MGLRSAVARVGAAHRVYLACAAYQQQQYRLRIACWIARDPSPKTGQHPCAPCSRLAAPQHLLHAVRTTLIFKRAARSTSRCGVRISSQPAPGLLLCWTLRFARTCNNTFFELYPDHSSHHHILSHSPHHHHNGVQHRSSHWRSRLLQL